VEQIWHFAAEPQIPPTLREVVGGHPIVARLLAQRGITDPQAARAFVDPAYYRPAPPQALPGLSAAVGLLREAIAQGKRLRIWGDLDADGQTSTALLFEALSALGAHVDYAVPAPDEGHGLHLSAVQEALRQGVALLITCDTGTGDIASVRRARSSGMDVIITDHHDPEESLPEANALVNPKLLPKEHPLYDLTGVGVAYLLAQALLEGREERCEPLLDLVAVGMIADVATQRADTRYLIQRGLQVLRSGRRLGLRTLIQVAGLSLEDVSDQDVGYQLGPRLNAAGRLAHAAQVVRLLLTQDPQEADELARKLDLLNQERRVRFESAYAQALEQIERDPFWRDAPVIILEAEGWAPGVLGLVAGRLAGAFGRPAVVIAHSDAHTSIGSARSVEGIDIHEAIAAQNALLLRQGGHPMAAGFMLARENVPRFRQELLRWFAIHAPTPLPITLEIDALLPWEALDLDLALEVNRLAPFGQGNPRPIFAVQGAQLLRVEDVSRSRETPHRRLYLSPEGQMPRMFVWFNAGEIPLRERPLDVAFYVGVNRYKGRRELQLELLAWRHSERPGVSTSPLVRRLEVHDWRTRKEDPQALLQELSASYGSRLAVWAEGQTTHLPGAVDRRGLPESCLALALCTAPAGPDVLAQVIGRCRPQVLYLLPPLPVHEWTPQRFLERVKGALLQALRGGGKLDLTSLAGQLAAREDALWAALRGLAAGGQIALERRGAVCHVRRAQGCPDPATQRQARERLLHLLREARAYRAAYVELSVDALLPDIAEDSR